MLLKQIDGKGELFVDLFVGLAHKATGSFFESEGDRGEERRQLHMEKLRSLSPAQISRTVAALLDVQRKWDSVGPGDSITVTWTVGSTATKNGSVTRKRA